MNYNYQIERGLASHFMALSPFAWSRLITTLMGIMLTVFVRAQAQELRQLPISSQSRASESIPVRIENSTDLPLRITSAQVEFNLDSVTAEQPNQLELELGLLNQSDMPISGLALEISTPASSKKFHYLAEIPTLAPQTEDKVKRPLLLPKFWLSTLPQGWQSSAARTLTEIQIRVDGFLPGPEPTFNSGAEWKWSKKERLASDR